MDSRKSVSKTVDILSPIIMDRVSKDILNLLIIYFIDNVYNRLLTGINHKFFMSKNIINITIYFVSPFHLDFIHPTSLFRRFHTTTVKSYGPVTWPKIYPRLIVRVRDSCEVFHFFILPLLHTLYEDLRHCLLIVYWRYVFSIRTTVPRLLPM